MTHHFPTVEEVMLIHDGAIREFGGSLGLRDMGALESALFRPQIGYYDGLVEEASAVRDGLRVQAVLNCADPGNRSRDNTEAAAAVGELERFEYLPTPLRRRKAFANAAGAGLSVLELKPADRKAITELQALINMVF